jgi:hypothetical protein
VEPNHHQHPTNTKENAKGLSGNLGSLFLLCNLILTQQEEILRQKNVPHHQHNKTVLNKNRENKK